MLVSVILNVRNEEDNITSILDSLVIQEPPVDIVVVDAASTDKTREIVLRYANQYPFVRMYVRPGSRGTSMNHAVSKAKGDVVAFANGDDIANPNWVRELKRSFEQGADIVAGRSMMIGLKAWEELDRVELMHRGFDCSYPGANIAYRKKILEELGGFDSWFITAEDIDLNYRAVDAGYTIAYNHNAIIYRRTRSTVYGFFHQAYWNGAGRKQLTMKHGNLWKNYDPLKMFKQKMTFWAFLRLIAAIMGYVGFKFFHDKEPYGRKGRKKAGQQRQ